MFIISDWHNLSICERKKKTSIYLALNVFQVSKYHCIKKSPAYKIHNRFPSRSITVHCVIIKSISCHNTVRTKRNQGVSCEPHAICSSLAEFQRNVSPKSLSLQKQLHADRYMLVHRQALISPSWCAGGEDIGKKEGLTLPDTLTAASLPVLLLSSSLSIRCEVELETTLYMQSKGS